MRFEIVTSELKNMIARASVLTSKKSVLEFMGALKFEVDANGKFSVVSTDIESYVSISTTVSGSDAGIAYVSVDEISKVITNMSGVICIELHDNKLIVKNSKKKTEIFAENFYKSYPDFPTLDMPTVFVAKENDVVETFDTLEPMLQHHTETHPVLSGFNIDAAKNRCVACDGYRYTIKKLDWDFRDIELNIVIPGNVAKHLKKIANVKRRNDVTVLVGKLNRENQNTKVAFIGTDFVYVTKLLSGNYIDIDRVTPARVDYEFTIDSAEFEAVAKEYANNKVEKDKSAPMYFVCENNNIVTATMATRYKTMDVLEGSEVHSINNPLIMYCNAKFMREAMEIFDGEKISAHGENRTNANGYCLSGILFENDIYKAYVLPCSPKSAESIDKVREFACLS